MTRGSFVRQCLDVMCSLGFDRSRFYESTHDSIRNEPRLVLVAEAPEPGVSRVGWGVDYRESTVARLGTGLFPAVGTYSDPAAAAFVEELELEGRSWVEVPLTAASEVMGLLACDWPAAAGELPEDDREVLRACGALIGGHLALKPIYVLERYRDERVSWPSTRASELVERAAVHLAEAVDAAATAVFAFSWPDQRLRRCFHHLAEGYRPTRELPPEEYPVDVHLTGKAWLDKKFRHIPDFTSLDRFPSDLKAKESFDWHTELFGTVTSVMYAPIGGLDKRYLVRFINRAKRPELPFISEADVLETILGELRSDFDAAIAAQRSESMYDLAAFASDGSDPVDVLGRVATSLSHDGVANIATLLHQEESAQLGFARGVGERVPPTFKGLGEWRDDSLYCSAVAHEGVYRLAEHVGRSGVADVLDRHGFKATLALPVRAGSTRGALLVPLVDVPPRAHARRHELPADAGVGTSALLRAHAQMICDAFESLSAKAKVDGARRALGLIGHELRGPLARANSEAELAVNVARRALRRIADERVSSAERSAEVERHLVAMWDAQRRVSVALELAPLVAQESEGRLQLHFERADVSRLLLDTIRDVEDELRLERSRRPVFFDVKSSARRLPPIVCDAVYMAHVFKNILRNAVKYSLPRHRGQPMEIEIIGEPQRDFVAVKVRNWGLGIPEDRREFIFEPWVRGDVRDERKAIGGMGLGLFLVRRILSAHGGRVLFSSEPTLDDPKRTRALEGFATEFEVRIPRTLKPGTHTHQWRAPTG